VGADDRYNSLLSNSGIVHDDFIFISEERAFGS
jgi:hypothetical protein